MLQMIRTNTMKEDVFNTNIRKLLKEFGVTAQREIEKAVRQVVAKHRLKRFFLAPRTRTTGGITQSGSRLGSKPNAVDRRTSIIRASIRSGNAAGDYVADICPDPIPAHIA
jgi:hypothetical protein